MVSVLNHLGFLPNTNSPNVNDIQLCHDLWSLVRGEQRSGVSFDTLRVIFLNFIGVKTLDREGDAPEEEENEEEQREGDESAEKPHDEFTKLGFYHENDFYLRRGVHSILFTHFKNFYVHRVQFVGGVQKGAIK